VRCLLYSGDTPGARASTDVLRAIGRPRLQSLASHGIARVAGARVDLRRALGQEEGSVESGQQPCAGDLQLQRGLEAVDIAAEAAARGLT
jgi:hypothetical protein